MDDRCWSIALAIGPARTRELAMELRSNAEEVFPLDTLPGMWDHAHSRAVDTANGLLVAAMRRESYS